MDTDTDVFLDKWTCGCGAEFYHLDLQPGKIQFNPRPELPTLRDQFATAALGGILAGWGPVVDVWPDGSVEELAYRVADAMMVERGKEPTS
jgi:hypothetical protein